MGFWGSDTTPTKPQSSGGFWGASPIPTPAPKPAAAPVAPKKVLQPTDNSFWGIAKNTITGIPKAIGTVVKSDVALVKDAAVKVGKIGATVFPGIPQIAKGLQTGDFSNYKKGFADTVPSGPLTYKDPVTGKLKVNDEEARKMTNLVAGFTGGESGGVKNVVKNVVDDVAGGVAKRVPSSVDHLIAEGKVRVVRRGEADVYQVKKGNFWKNTRDESSAVEQVTHAPKVKVEAPHIEELKSQLGDMKVQKEIASDALSNHPGKSLIKYRSAATGDLPYIEKASTSKFGKKGDAIGQDAVGQEFSGNGDWNTLNGHLSDYVKLRDQTNETVSAVKTIRSELATARKQALKHDANGVPLALTKRQKDIVARNPNRPIEVTPATEKPFPFKKAPPISEGEMKSFEILAKKQGLSEPRIPRDLLPASEKIPEQTSVKNKVNLLDYLRTPDRVLKKVGLGKEAAILRTQYESYLKELPKNIEKITEWSKRAGKMSSGRIFRYLDGEAVDLAPREQEVAGEIKTWLRDWADRLGLPEDKRIAEYITHIFDDQFIKKEFDEDLAKIISEKIPGQVYNPFLQARLGTKGYKQDVFGALDAYAKRATRKVHMDPALELIQQKAGGFEESQFDYVKRFIDNVNLRPNKVETLADNWIKTVFGYKLGQRPSLVITRGLRKMTYRAMLGLNPGSAIRNLSQGANTYAKLGERYTLTGYAKLLTPAGRKELMESGVLDNSFIQDRSLSATKKTMEVVDKGLFAMFDAAEKVNRGAAYLGAKARGLSKGMAEAQAIAYAKKIVRDTQFSFGSIDTPVGLSSDLVKTLTQFQSYTTKQIEFLTEMARNKEILGLMRYGASGLLFVYTIGQAIGMKPEQLIPTLRFDQGLIPPSAKAPAALYDAVAGTPDKFGTVPSLGKRVANVGGAVLTTMVPAGSQVKKSYQGLKAIQEGGSFSSNGNLLFQAGGTPLKDAQALFFGKYASAGAKEYFNKSASPEEKRLQPVYDQVQQLNSQGKKDEALALVNSLTEDEYATYKKIKAAATTGESKNMIPTVKQVQKLVNDGKTEEAKAIVNDLSEADYKAYTKAKKQLTNNPETDTSESSFIDDVATYAHAVGTDPVTAFNRIFTGQRIRRVDGGSLFGNAIIVERMPFSESQAIRKEGNANNPSMRLDHIIPLELGGSNDKSNLKLVTTEQWKANSPLENHLGKLLRDKKIGKAEAQSLITKYKNGEITAEEILKRN